jgi:hypothetical protein
MATVVKKSSQEERTILALNNSLDKRFATREVKISKLEEKRRELISDLERYVKVHQEYVELYNNIHMMTKKETIYSIIPFLRNGIIKLHQLSSDGMAWIPWLFNTDEVEDMINEIIFHVPVKCQLLKHIKLHEKHCLEFTQKEIVKINSKIEKINGEKQSIQTDTIYKIKYENAFVTENVQTIFIRMINCFGYINVHVWNNVYSLRIITPKQLNRCISTLKLFNELRLQKMLHKFIYSTPESVMGYTKSYTGVIMELYKRMLKTHKVMKKIQTVVEYLYTKKPNSVRPLAYKQFTREFAKFKVSYANLWATFYTKSIPFIRDNITFSDILVNKIYEYVH